MIRLQANHLMEVLGWKDLRLTLDETEGIAQLRAKHKLFRAIIQRVHRQTDGWAAGLVLSLERAEIEELEPARVEKYAPEEIFDYFAGEIFDRTDQEEQEFLLKTAFFPKMTVEMAAELTGLPSAYRLLSTLSRNNYFTERRFHPEPIYQYHPLFRDFLLSRAKEIFSPETLSVLLRRAAILLERNAQTEAAVRLLREAHDWDGMVPVIMKHAATMVTQGRSRLLEEWLAALPPEVLENHPWLLYWLGACRLPIQPLSARTFFEKSLDRFRREENPTGIFLSWAGIGRAIFSGFDDFKPLDRLIPLLGELTRACRGYPSKEVEAQVAGSMFIALLLRQPGHPAMKTWTEKVLKSIAYLHQHNR